MTTVSRTEGQYLMPQKTFIKNNASKWQRLICSVCRFNFFNNSIKFNSIYYY
jgi:hypothetical protein